MAQEKDAKGGLVPKGQEDVELQRALGHPVVQHMTEKLDQMRSMVEQLPEAIGKAVAAAMSQSAAKQPPVPTVPVRMTEQNPPVEFRPGGLVTLAGREEAGHPAGILKLLSLVGISANLTAVEKWTPKQRQQVVTWARAQHFSTIGKKGVRVPERPEFLK